MTARLAEVPLVSARMRPAAGRSPGNDRAGPLIPHYL